MSVGWWMWVYSKLMVTLDASRKANLWSCAVDGPVHVHPVSVSSLKAQLLHKSHFAPIKCCNLSLKKSLTTITVIPPLIPNYASLRYLLSRRSPSNNTNKLNKRWTGIIPLLKEQKHVIQWCKLTSAHYFCTGSSARVWGETRKEAHTVAGTKHS